jgi:hypothetical protein
MSLCKMYIMVSHKTISKKRMCLCKMFTMFSHKNNFQKAFCLCKIVQYTMFSLFLLLKIVRQWLYKLTLDCWPGEGAMFSKTSSGFSRSA